MYYMKKISKTFRLSPEAVKVLEEQGNQSQYLEELILDKGTEEQLTVKHLRAMEERINSRLDAKSLKNDLPTANEGDSMEAFLSDYSDPTQKKPPHPVHGYPCCHNATPCKHWTWSQAEVAWVNTLTGAIKEE